MQQVRAIDSYKKCQGAAGQRYKRELDGVDGAKKYKTIEMHDGKPQDSRDVYGQGFCGG